jgi:hypothetical protein
MCDDPALAAASETETKPKICSSRPINSAALTRAHGCCVAALAQKTTVAQKAAGK